MPDNPTQSMNGSVVLDMPPPNNQGRGIAMSDYILFVSGVADLIPAWGTQPKARDLELRRFWPTEPILAGAIGTTVSKYASFEWDLDGPDRMVNMYTRILHSSEHGRGWMALMVPFITDYLTQDNGGHMEIVRTDDLPTAPVIQLNHLDSNRCERTGNAQTPIIYWDLDGKAHELRWYQVLSLCEMPSPETRQRGRQYCAVTRVLEAARLMRDVTQYKRERATGQDTKQIHLVGGVSPQKVEAAVAQARLETQAQGMQRFTRSAIVGSYSPEARVSAETLDLAKLPDGYDEEKAQRDYITVVALALGNDYQEYAPLPTGAQGSGAQSEVLAMKARGKGSNFFMRSLEHLFNFHGILPQNVTFTFGTQDAAQD